MATPRTSGNSGGVKNLRAMFENKNPDPSSTSPPSRGRSPAGSDTSIINNSRPVSKVRTSFVAVERPGEGQQQMWGLRKASDVSSMAEVKEEAEKERQIGTTGRGTAVQTESRPNGTLTGARTKKDTDLALDDVNKTPAPTKTPTVSPSKPVSKTKGTEVKTFPSEDKEAVQSQSNSTSNKATEESSLSTEPAQETKKLNGVAETQGEKGIRRKSSSAVDAALDRAKPKLSAGTASAKKSPNGRAATQSGKTQITPNQKQPATKGALNKPAAVMTSAQTASIDSKADSKVTKKPSQPSLKSHATTKMSAAMKKSSPTSSKASRTKQALSTASPPSKARPRSPTRPVRLPASATAPTVSSVAKTGTAQASASPPSKIRPRSPTRPVRLPASATAQTASSAAKTGAARSPSRASVSQSGLARNASTAKRVELPANRTHNSAGNLSKRTSRVSIGSQTHDNGRPKSRVSVGSKTTDDGFLARMMRPTTSSAQKTHDKAESNNSPKTKGKAVASRREPSKTSPVLESSKTERSSSVTPKEEEVTSAPIEDVVDATAHGKVDATSNIIDLRESNLSTAPTEKAADPGTSDVLGDSSSLSDVKEDHTDTNATGAAADSVIPTDPDGSLDAPGVPKSDSVPSSPKGAENAPISTDSENFEKAPITTDGNIAAMLTEKRDGNASDSTDVQPEILPVDDSSSGTPMKETGPVAEGTGENNKAMETF